MVDQPDFTISLVLLSLVEEIAHAGANFAGAPLGDSALPL